MDSSPKFLPISAPDAIDAKAEAELPRLLYRTAGFGLFSNFALAIILVAGTWTYVSPAPRLAWLTAILVVSLARLVLQVSFARGRHEDATLGPWRTAFGVGWKTGRCRSLR